MTHPHIYTQGEGSRLHDWTLLRGPVGTRDGLVAVAIPGAGRFARTRTRGTTGAQSPLEDRLRRRVPNRAHRAGSVDIVDLRAALAALPHRFGEPWPS